MGSATYVCSSFVCPNNGIWLLVFRTVNVRTGVGHAIAHGSCTDTVRKSALEADSGRKIVCRTGDWNSRQYRPLSFMSLSHSDTQSESTTKSYNSSKADVGGNVLTLTSCVLRSDRTESVWMPGTDLVTFLVHSIRLLRKNLRHLTVSIIYINDIDNQVLELLSQ